MAIKKGTFVLVVMGMLVLIGNKIANEHQHPRDFVLFILFSAFFFKYN